MERYSGQQKNIITALALLDDSDMAIENKLLVASIKFETTRELLDQLLNLEESEGTENELAE